ncbi:MAG: hypothetical protein IPM35_24295 [Myxococcales bacterium]|nr:hypothetical protein [Myxococcales bacterium]
MTGFRECNFVARPCPRGPRLLACQRPDAELAVDSPVVTALELRAADGAPLTELIDDVFYEVVGEVDSGAIPVVRVHSVRSAKPSDRDCQRPAQPGRLWLKDAS